MEIQVTKKQSGVTCLRVYNFPEADSEETGMNKVSANEPKCVSSCFRKSGVFYEIRANNLSNEIKQYGTLLRNMID